MSKTYAFAVGAVIGVALALSPGCGTATNCTAANCQGCCTMNGLCANGQTAAECGQNGATCQQCTGDQGCTPDGICAVIGNQGGGSSSNGGGSASNGGGSTSNGGGGGGSSSNGGGGTHTGGGGGTIPNGGGVASTGGGSGGGSGATGGGTSGAGGGMLGTCGPSNCANGCCLGATCISGAQQNDNQCGQGGFGCLMCATGNTCTAGTCMGAVTCGPSNCSAGCCSGGNTCLPVAQENDSSCGLNGVTCAACTGNQSCQSGTCQTAATLGGPCSGVSDCASLGTGAICKLTTTEGAPYPQGFCTMICSGADGDSCASGQGTCIGGGTSVIAVYGEGDIICTPNCATPGGQSTCRNGYACYGDTSGFCWLNPIPDFDGGGFPNKLGTPCTQDTQCQNPPAAEWGLCEPALDDMDNQTGFTGGYCIADCTYDNTGNFCGPNGACFDFTTDPTQPVDLCLRTCPNPGGGHSSIRSGSQYSCLSAIGVDGGIIGYLWPACNQPGEGCPTGLYCQTSTGYCCDAGVCQD